MAKGILRIGKTLIIKDNGDNDTMCGRIENINIKNSMLIVSSPSTFKVNKGQRLSIMIPTIEGMFNFDADLIDVSKEPKNVNLILKLPPKLIRIQRRRATRIPYLTRIMLLTEKGRTIKGITLDVSTIGVGILSEEGLTKGDRIMLSFSLKPITEINALSAVVVWIGRKDPHIDKYSYGLKFESMNETTKDAIQKFVNLKLESVNL